MIHNWRSRKTRLMRERVCTVKVRPYYWRFWALNCFVPNLSDLILAKEKSPPFACNKSAMVEKKRSMVLEQNYIFQPIFFAFFAIMFNSAIFRQRLRVFTSILSSFTVFFDWNWAKCIGTGKSFSEVLFLASTNPQYDKRLFFELRVQYMKIPSWEHVVYINCSECQNKNKK